MKEQVSPLATFYKPGWENYQQALVKTITQLSSEQLALSVGPQSASIGELLAQMIGTRVNWFFAWMGEGDAAMAAIDRWASSDESAVPDAAALASMFEKTWRVISCVLDRWTSADLEQSISPPASQQEWRRSHGQEEEPAHTRQWMVWHVMKQEIHHGGELALALRNHGINSLSPS